MKVAICCKYLKKKIFTNYVPNICKNYSDLRSLYIFTDLNLNCKYGIRTCVALIPADMLAPVARFQNCIWGDAAIEVCPRH